MKSCSFHVSPWPNWRNQLVNCANPCAMVDAFPVLGINYPALWSSQASWRPEAELPNSMSWTQLLPCFWPYSSCSSSGTCYRWWRESWTQRRNCKDFRINCNCQSWRFYQTVLHLQNHHSQQFIYNSWWQNIQTYSYRIHTDKCTPPWCQSNLREYQHIRNKHLFGPFARQSWC